MIFALLSLLSAPPITVSKEITYITEPLRADGMVDYFAWVNRPLAQLKPDDNAAVFLARAYGPGIMSNEEAAEYFRLLRCSAPPREGVYLSNPPRPPGNEADNARLQALFHHMLELMHSPWRAADEPLLADWLHRNEQPLELVREASRRPRLVDAFVATGSDSFIFPNSPLADALVRATELLTCRAMENVGAGKIDAALADLDVIHRLASLTTQSRQGLRSGVHANYCRSSALDAEVVVAVSGGMTPVELRRRARRLFELESVGPALDPSSPFERVSTLSATWSGMRAPFPVPFFGGGGGSSETYPRPREEIEEALRTINVWTDRWADAYRRPLAECEAKLELLEKELDAAAAKDGAFSAAGADPKAKGRKRAEDRLMRMTDDMRPLMSMRKNEIVLQRQAALAYLLRAHKIEHGRYPDRLDAAALGAPTEVVLDPFADKPFSYAVENGKARIRNSAPPPKPGLSQPPALELP